MQRPDEEIFTPLILDQIQRYLSDLRSTYNEVETEIMLQKGISKLPNFLQKEAIENSVIRQFKLFLEILLVKYREHKTQSTDFIVQATLAEFKQPKKVPAELVRTPLPRPRSVHKIDFARLALQAQAPEPLLNTTSSSFSARNQPTPISHKSPVEKRENVIRINLLGNTDTIKAWFAKNVSVSTPQGESFYVPVLVDKKVYTLEIYHTKSCDNPSLLIALCDKDKPHTELLQKLKTVTQPILFLRTDEKKSANENIMTEKKFKKFDLKAVYYEIDPARSAIGQLQATIEKIPEIIENLAQNKNESCLAM